MRLWEKAAFSITGLLLPMHFISYYQAVSNAT